MLALENEMARHKERLDELNHRINILEKNGELDLKTRELEKDYYEAVLEDYLSSIDRLCYCILHGNFKERDWRTEYREYVSNVVRSFPDKFAPGSIYTNITDLNNIWLRV